MTTPLPTVGPKVWARIASLFVDFAVHHGSSRHQLLAAVHLDESALADPDGRVPLLAIYDILEVIERQTGDSLFGLELPLGLQIDALDALGFLFITSATFGGGLERMVRYQRLWNEGERLEIRVENSHASVVYEPYGPYRPAHVLMAQITMCDFVVNSARFVPGLQFERVRFRHGRPEHSANYERVLGVPVEFDCAEYEARFSERMLQLPIPDANATLCAFFERYASERLNQLPSTTSVADLLRALIRRQLPEGDLKLSALAERLHMSARTLQRRLGDEGTSLQAVLDEVRRQQALYFLKNGTAIAELSWLLGYSEPSALHRAFKRWTGTSPEAWRARQRGDGPSETNPSA
jgi:AraC-like DNA-binding protein